MDLNNSKKNPFGIKETNLKSLRFNRDKDKDWLEESILNSVINKEGNRKEFLGISIDSQKLKWLLIFLLIGFLILFLKTAYLQIVRGDYYRGIAEGNRIRIQTIKADRGLIFDRNKIPLVENIPNFSFSLIPGDLPRKKSSREDIINKIAEITGELPEKINEIVKSYPYLYYQPVPIKENISYEEAILLKIASADLPGIILEIEARREYLNKINEKNIVLSLSHILGYLGRISKKELEKNKDEYGPNDFLGKSGIELSWESVLRGKNGKKQIEVDALGKEKRVISEEEPIAGKNLILSLDLKLQEKIENILNTYLKRFGKKRGSVIALNPNNGEILALVSLPAFDNNIFTKGITEEEYQNLINNPNRPLFNRSINGEYPSGSTIKPIIAAAALEEGIINQNTTFLSTGGLWYDKWFFPDWAKGGHGLTNVTRAIAQSINTFFYIIGGGYNDFIGLGVNKIAHYMDLFGLGKKLGIDLPNESSGLIPTPEWKEKIKNEQWYIGDTYHLSIGQGDILVTPLQIASVTAFFANKGILFKPHLVKEIIDPETNKTIEIKPEIIHSNFISPQNIEIVKQGLRQTVTAGSAKILQEVIVKVAGKTGTAEWGKGRSPHAWFTGFAPYENPEIVITVLVEEGGEGSTISVPIAKEILNWYFSNRQLSVK